jgi:hypothetical protein
MRSSQLNFFLTRIDQEELLTKLDPLETFVYLESTARDGSLRILESAEINKMGSDRLRIFISLAKYVDEITLEQSSATMFIDDLRSPVVEFSRCYQDDQCIRRGRFYFAKSYLDRRALVYKDQEFLEWGNSLISRARGILKKEPESFAYFGREAFRLKGLGLKMELG